MTKYMIAVIVLPYTVLISTPTSNIGQSYQLNLLNDKGYSCFPGTTPIKCDWLYDLAEALNTAHTTRVKK